MASAEGAFEDFELSACSWVERAWHGLQIESLSSQKGNGLLASSSKRVRSRINVEPGIFLLSDNVVIHAREYFNFVYVETISVGVVCGNYVLIGIRI